MASHRGEELLLNSAELGGDFVFVLVSKKGVRHTEERVIPIMCPLEGGQGGYAAHSNTAIPSMGPRSCQPWTTLDAGNLTFSL